MLAHVPDINDFVAGFSLLLKPEGVASFEFPHLLNMVQQNQFDTAYHEHYSYLSLHAVQTIFERNGLQIIDVQDGLHMAAVCVCWRNVPMSKRPVQPGVGDILERT
jgi:hypothetical protein